MTMQSPAYAVPGPTAPVSGIQTLQFEPIVASAANATEVVTAVAGKRIIVTSLVLVANEAVNAKFQSDGAATDLTGLFYLAANGGVVLPFQASGWFATIVGEALDIHLSAAKAVGGVLTYVLA